MKMALMIIDLQKAYYQGDSRASMDMACEYINEVLPFFREKGLPILWVQHSSQEGGAVQGTEGYDLLDCLKPEASEYRINKTYGNSFTKTDCAKILENNGVDTVIITGYCAEYCVLSTYRGAMDLDLTPVILKNGTASFNPEGVKFVENISEVISYRVLKKILQA